MLPEGEGFPLRGEALRNWLRTSGQGIFTEFETGREALDYLREQGASIRDADFYAIRREVANLGTYAGLMGDVPDNQYIPLAYHVTDHGLDLSRDFMYRVKVSGTDPATGEDIDSFFAISSDRQLTKGEVIDQLGALIEGASEFYDIVPEEYEVTTALRRPED